MRKRGIVFNGFLIKICVVFTSALFLASCEFNTSKTGYIDINVINSEYKLAQKYDEHLKLMESNIAGDLLGLQAELNILQDSITNLKEAEKEVSQSLLKSYFIQKSIFEKESEQKLKEIKDSTLYYRSLLDSIINKKVFEYGQKNNFQYLYSPAGSGTFMYADSTLNVTKEVLEYLNQ